MLQITVLALEGSAVDLSDKLGAVNLTGFIAEAVSLLTMIVAACVAAYVIFRVFVPTALRWLRSSVGDAPPGRVRMLEDAFFQSPEFEESQDEAARYYQGEEASGRDFLAEYRDRVGL